MPKEFGSICNERPIREWKSTKNQSLLLIDAFAIISIVLFHAQFYLFNEYRTMSFLMFFGLSLFSISAGYKLMYNHSLELHSKVFLRQYLAKRFIRLYKPVIGYTFLILPLLYGIGWIAQNLFSLNYLVSVFGYPIEDLLWRFMIGESPALYHLWYLIMLIEVTIFCLSVLYIFDVRVLFFMGFIMGILYLSFQDAIVSETIRRNIKYLIIFIMGMFLATKINLPQKIEVPILRPLLKIGSLSFYIYLFQWPFIMPIPGRILNDMLHIHCIFVPIFLTIFTIAASIIIYRVMKALAINRLIE